MTQENINKTGGIAQIAAIGVNIGTSIWGTAASVKDAKVRANLEKDLALLNQQQANQLEINLQNTQSIDKRIEILSNSIANIKATQSGAVLSSTILAAEKTKARKDVILTIVIFGGAIAILAAIVILKKK
jgi:hypothetical protein